jgi:hypothetical protein
MSIEMRYAGPIIESLAAQGFRLSLEGQQLNC